MKRRFTNRICTMTGLREPQKGLDRAGGKPMAIMKASKCVGYLAPEETTLQSGPRYVTMDKVMASVEKRREIKPLVPGCPKDR